VKKVPWRDEAPWFREIQDGFCWLCYCMNNKCEAFNQLVVINRGYNAFTISKDLKNLICPLCKSGNLPGPNGEEPTL
jgi:hypothetical protein